MTNIILSNNLLGRPIVLSNLGKSMITRVPIVSGGGTTTFASNWSFSTGTGGLAVSDNNAFDLSACSSPLLNVISGSDVGFTETTNVLRVEMDGENCRVVEKSAAYPESTTHYVRIYVRNDVDDDMSQDHAYAYNNLHGQSIGGDIQAAPLCIWTNIASANFWRLGIILRFAYPQNRWYTPELPNDTWFRYEYMFEFVDATHYRVWPRVYNMAGTLLYTSDDFRREGSGTQSLTEWYDIGGANRSSELAGIINGDIPNVTDAAKIGLGNPGPSGNTITGQYFYFAKFEVNTGGWIGQ